MSFPDHFSPVAAAYARFRPLYPQSLFAVLARLAPDRRRAWDCATGSGQAALALSAYFRQVVATDASLAQLTQAPLRERVQYLVAKAERAPLGDAVVDLLTVAQAVHWFDFDDFYAEARRVLRPGGLLALWGYALLRVSPEIDAVIDDLYVHVVGPYWPPQRCHLDDAYRSLPLPPWPREEAPELRGLALESRWSLADLLGYLGTWSAVGRYRRAGKGDPLPAVEARLAPLWGGGGRSIRWPLYLHLLRRPV